jgi:hypothetical protein
VNLGLALVYYYTMAEERQELVRIDGTGTAHPVGRIASQRLRARQGAFRMMPAPLHLIVMRFVGEDGKRDEDDGPIFRLSGEITTPGALCDIVALIGQACWRGELVVQDSDTSRSIFFENGQVISAQSNADGERLGEVLYRYGALTKEQVATAVDAVTSDLRFGEACVKLGYLTREKLFQLMGKQTEEIVYAVLLVGDGMFYFLETYDTTRLASRLNLPVNSLLMEGVRRMDETAYFRERIPSDQHVPARVPERSPPDEPDLLKVYDAIDGARSVADIGREVGQGEFEVTQVLFQLLQSGRVVVHAPRPTGAAAIVERFNHAIAALMGEVDKRAKGGEIREQLASFATGAGVYDALFQKAGPAADGTLETDRVVENISVLVGPSQAEAMLSQWLYEYASFALFLSEPVIRQSDSTTPSVTKRVAELISPLAPT